MIDGALTIGQLMFFYTLLGHMLQPLERLASLNLEIQDALVAVDRLYQILDVEAEDGGDSGAVELEGVHESVELHGVGFSYADRSNVLNNVDLRIPAGSRVAIVGESGSGKTTLLKLLLRYYHPTEGRITIDGTDLRDVSLPSLRSKIGVVSQEPFIFNASIRENIRCGKPEATLREITEAARLAHLDELVNTLPQRYDTQIGERGANLSGGQRQRLAIARALLMDPDVLIFDEATSHLDTETEQAIQKALRSKMRGKTVILVAHRLSTLGEADTIYVLGKGRVIESGTHEELMARGGRYASLWRAQSSGAAVSRPRAKSKRLAAPPAYSLKRA